MEAIVDAIDTLINFIETIWEFIQNIFSAITVAFDIIGRVITMAFEFILTMPAFISGFAILTIIISIVYFIIGREAGKSE